MMQIIAYRNPVKPLTITRNVGGKELTNTPYFKKRKYYGKMEMEMEKDQHQLEIMKLYGNIWITLNLKN